MMKWNERQQQVLDTNDKNMLVSAAAGSGKTAVLVEKIKNLIIDKGVDVTELLVVTFTRAAASEMKEKIIRAMNKAAQEDPEKADALRRQIENIGRAQISTYDSFAKDVVSKYFYIIDVDPGLRMADEHESSILKAEAMDQTFEEIYEEDDPDVMGFMDAYQQASSDSTMKEDLISIYDQLRKMPEGISWLADCIERDPAELKRTAMELAKIDLREALAMLDSAAKTLEEGGYENQAALLSGEADYVRGVLASEEDSIINGISGHKDAFGTLRYSKDEKARAEEDGTFANVKSLRDGAKKIIKGLAGELGDLGERVDEVRRTLPYQKVLLTILERYEEVYRQKKMDKGVMDFDDSSHYALEILENEDVAAEYRDRFRYIFIDEYQDSNYLQEALISKIKRDDNLFMVGDIKQSIYGFRHAEPDIFKKRSEVYSSAEDVNSTKIDLNANYRSKAEIIDSVNEVFEGLMDGYDEDAALVKGDPYDGEISYPTELHIIDMKPSDPEEEGTGQDEEDERVQKQRTEIEAGLAADIIAQSIGKPIFDTQAGVERTLEKRDIVILLRAAKNKAEKYYEALMERGIDAYVDDNSGYYETVEIRTVIDMLKVIDNRYRDIPLLSVLRSGLFDFTNEDLIEIRLSAPDVLFSEAFFGYPGSGEADSELTAKIDAFTAKLDRWAELASYTPVDEFIWRLTDESGYYAFAGSLPAGAQRMANLRSLVGKATDFASRSDGTVREFIGFVEQIDERELGAKQKSLKNENENIVRIMTIHKSKGLEFPMVIVAGTGDRPGGGRGGSSRCGIMHKDVGYAMPLIDKEKKYRKNTLAMELVKRRKAQDELEEAIRVLYVACTRPKDRLVLIGTVSDWEAEEKKLGSGIVQTGTYLDMLLSSSAGRTIERTVHKAEDLTAPKIDEDAERERKKLIDELFSGASEDRDPKLKGEIERRLSFRYPFMASLEKKSKYSVSELNSESKKKREAGSAVETYDVQDAYDLGYRKAGRVLKVPSFVEGEGAEEEAAGGITGKHYGTVMHAVMEHIDFAAAEAAPGSCDGSDAREKLVEEKVLWMKERGLLLPEEAAAVSLGKIAAFFDSEIGKRAANAAREGRLYKEKHFTIKHILDGTDEEVLVQGIIDCWFEDEDGNLVLVDYKTNSRTEGIRELYEEQIALYTEALEKATGRKVKESYLYLFKTDEAVSMQ